MHSLSDVSARLTQANTAEFTLSDFYPPQNSTPDQIVEKAKACLLCLYGNIESAKISKIEYYNYVKFHWDKSQEIYDRQEMIAKKMQKICEKLILQGVMHKLFDKELVVKLKDTYDKPLKLTNYNTIQLSLISPMISNAFTYECKESKDNFLDLNMSKDTFLKFIKMDKNFAISNEESITHILEYYEGANYLGIDWLKRKLTNFILKNKQNLDIESQKSVYDYFSSIITYDSKQICESIFITMGEYYIQQSQWNEAAILVDTAMKNNMDVSLITYLKSLVHTAQKDYAGALETIHLAIEKNSKDPRYYIHRAHVNHLLTANPEAIIDLDKALILDPNNVSTLCKRGDIFYKQGDNHKALDDYNRALQIDKNNEYALERRCKIFLQQNNKYKLQMDSEIILRINPKNVFALNIQGNILYEEKNYTEALKRFNTALQIDPTTVDALNSRGKLHKANYNSDQALQDFDKVLQLDPENEFALAARGDLHWSYRKYDDALKDCDKVLQLNPYQVLALNTRATILAEHGKYKESLIDLNKSLEIEPSNNDILCKRIDILILLDKLDEALIYINSMFGANYDFALSRRGEIFRRTSRYKEAREDFDTKLKHYQGDCFAWESRAELNRQEGRYEEALFDLLKASQTHTQSAFALCCEGEIYRAQGKMNLALEKFDKALQFDANYICALMFKINIIWQQRKFEEALKELDKAMQVDSNITSILSFRGDIYWQQGKYAEALKDFDAALKVQPDCPFTLHRRGNIYKMQGKHVEALKDFEDVLKIYTKNNSLLYTLPVGFPKLTKHTWNHF